MSYACPRSNGPSIFTWSASTVRAYKLLKWQNERVRRWGMMTHRIYRATQWCCDQKVETMEKYWAVVCEKRRGPMSIDLLEAKRLTFMAIDKHESVLHTVTKAEYEAYYEYSYPAAMDHICQAHFGMKYSCDRCGCDRCENSGRDSQLFANNCAACWAHFEISTSCASNSTDTTGLDSSDMQYFSENDLELMDNLLREESWHTVYCNLADSDDVEDMEYD